MLDKLDAALRFSTRGAQSARPASGSAGSKHRQCRYPGYQARDIDFASELKKSCNVDGMQPVWLH